MWLLSVWDRRALREYRAVLLSAGVRLKEIYHPDAQAWSVHVAPADAARAAAALSAFDGEERGRSRLRWFTAPARAAPPLWLQPAFVVAVCMSVVLLAFYGWVQGSAAAPVAVGRFVPRLVLQDGQWWRFLTAATLHADGDHVLSNAGFLWLWLWASGERLGPGSACLGWLVTAVLGNLASLVFTPEVSTVGASGGVFGLLGLAAGHGLACAALRRRQRVAGGSLAVQGLEPVDAKAGWRTAAAAVLLVAFTAFAPRSNIPAHLGGFAAGVGYGWALTRWPLLQRWLGGRGRGGVALGQVAAVVLTLAAVAGAWWVALARV